MGGSKVMMSNESHHTPPHEEAEKIRIRAHMVLVIELLIFMASAIAVPPSAPSLLNPRLQKETPNGLMMPSSF